MDEKGEDELLHSVALKNAQSILAARQRAEQARLEEQRELRESREMLRSALAAAGAGAFRWQPDADLMVLGESLQALVSQLSPPGTGTLQSMLDLFEAGARAELRARFAAPLQGGDPLLGEFRLQGLPERWMELRGRIETFEDGRSWLVGTMMEVSLRRSQAAALRESNELLRATFNQASVGIAISMLDGRLEQVNDKFASILGCVPGDLVGSNIMDLTHPDDVAKTAELVQQLLAGSIDEYSLEKRYLAPNGNTVWCQTTVAVMRDAHGAASRFIGAISDISQRKKTEHALSEERRVLETLNQTNAVLASQLELESLLQMVTDAATELCGAKFGAFFYNGTDENGQALMLYTLSGAPRAAFENFGHPRPTPIFAPTFRGEGAIRFDDITLDARYGHVAPHYGMPPQHLPVRSYLAIPVKSRSSEVLGALIFGHPQAAIFDERSERIVAGIAAQAAIAIDNARLYEAVRHAAAEREILLDAERAARAHAERAGRMKDEFLATLSHELRTPLSAVLGWAQMLLSRPADSEMQRRGGETIVRNAKAQSMIIEDLLDMNRIISGKLRIEVQPTWLATVAEAALESVKLAAEARDVKLTAVLDQDAGPVDGDPARLQQVVWNLLSNAVKFSHPGSTVLLTVAKSGSQVELVVKDEGVGIQPEFLPFVFDRFRQADSSTTRAVGGLGLGLAIVKELVELHDGSVEAFSNGDGLGSTFRIVLPSSSLSGDRGEPIDAGATPVSIEAIDLSGAHILIVDDEPDTREIVALTLIECGARVEQAGDADAALGMLRQMRYDLLVSDIGMPSRDGYQLIRALRQDLRSLSRKAPAIALTAFASSEDRSHALVAGYQMHLAKPVGTREFLTAAGTLLGRIPE